MIHGKRNTHYSTEPFSLEDYNYDDKYSTTGESTFSRDLTIPFDENEVLSERNYGYRGGYEAVIPEDEDFRGFGPKGYRRSDESILEDVCDALYVSSEIDASDIEIDVNQGIVTLSGTVERRSIKKQAEWLVEHVAGVVDVRNDLRIRPAPGGLMSENITGMN